MRMVVSSQVLDAGHVRRHLSVATQGHDPLTAVPPASYCEGSSADCVPHWKRPFLKPLVLSVAAKAVGMHTQV